MLLSLLCKRASCGVTPLLEESRGFVFSFSSVSLSFSVPAGDLAAEAGSDSLVVPVVPGSAGPSTSAISRFFSFSWMIIVNGIKRITKIYDENGSWKEDYTYYDNGVVSQKRILDEDGFIEDLRFDKNGKLVLRRADLIFVSDVRIRFQKLNRYTNPTQDSVMKIYDKHELANNPNQPFAFTGTVVEFYDQKYLIKKRQEEIKEGFYDGTSNWWYKNGGKQFEATFKKGSHRGKFLGGARMDLWNTKGNGRKTN